MLSLPGVLCSSTSLTSFSKPPLPAYLLLPANRWIKSSWLALTLKTPTPLAILPFLSLEGIRPIAKFKLFKLSLVGSEKNNFSAWSALSEAVKWLICNFAFSSSDLPRSSHSFIISNPAGDLGSSPSRLTCSTPQNL